MSYAAIAAQVVGGLVEMGGAIAGGIMEAEASQEAARIRATSYLLRYNDLQAAAVGTRFQGASAAKRLKSEASRAIGTQRHAAAGSGVDVSSGSAAALQVRSIQIGELDAMALVQQSERKARHIERQSAEAMRNMYQSLAIGNDQATTAKINAGIGAVSGLLGMAS